MIPQIVGGFTRMPNYFLDDQIGEVSPNSFCVLAYICRRTLGFNQLSARIPLKQFSEGLYSTTGNKLDKGCGITNKNTLLACLRELKAKGLISYTSVRGQDTTYTVILPASADLILDEEKASIRTDTCQVSELILANEQIPYSRKPKTFPRKKELEKKKEKRVKTAPIDFSKFEPGGKYHKLVQHN
jgi:hypothetical protein